MSMFDIALDYQRERDRFPRLKTLDYRELLMARLLAGGCSGREAGLKLGLNGEAAEAVRRGLLQKLGLATENELVSLVEAAGPPPDVAYVDDFRVSYFRPSTGPGPVAGDVVFAE